MAEIYVSQSGLPKAVDILSAELSSEQLVEDTVRLLLNVLCSGEGGISVANALVEQHICNYLTEAV
jgi:hypothetical protein